jgi:hypothetical protein
MRAKFLPMPPIEELRQYLRLDCDAGKIFWIDRKCVRYPLGSEAGVSPNGPRGYLCLGWNGKRYLTHRIIYYMHTGVDPANMLVDHINGNTSDNRPENLRLATLKQNAQNMRRPMKNSKTGVLGVHWNSQNRSWCAKLSVRGKKMCRFFQNFDDAVVAIKKLRLEHYGEFSGVEP